MYQIRLFFSLLVCLAAFLSSEFGVVSMQTSLPTAAKPTTADFFSSFRAVRVSGDRAYVASSAGLLIYDVSDRANPRQLSQLFIDPSDSYELEVSRDYAYVLSGQAVFEKPFLRAIDVRDPLAPRVVAEYTDLVESQVFDLHIVEMTLAIANQSNVDLLDISDPTNLRRVGRFEVVPRTGNFSSLAAHNSTLFAAYTGPSNAGQTGGQIIAIDISDASTPARIGDLALASPPQSIASVDDTLYIGIGYAVGVVDASNPSHLFQIGEFQLPLPPPYVREPPPQSAAVVARGNRLIAAATLGFRSPVLIPQPFPVAVFDISEPRSPHLLTQTQLRCEVRGMDLDVAQSDALMPAWDASGTGMSILDLTTNGELRPISNVFVPGFLDVAVDSSGTTFLVGANTLYSVRKGIGNRSEVLGKVSLSQGAARLQVAGGRAYVYTDADGLGTDVHIQIVDIADPSNMRVLGALSLGDYYFPFLATSKRFFVDGDKLYVAALTGLVIYDASDPTQLRQLGFFRTPNVAENVLVRDGIAYLITHRLKRSSRRIDLYVIDVRKPSRPKLKGKLRDIDVADFVTDLEVRDGRLYMVDTGGGDGTLYFIDGKLLVVNVAEPSAPLLESKIRTRPSRLSYAVAIHVAGENAYVADGLDGVSVFSIKGGAAPEFLRIIDTPDFANGVWVDDSGNVSVADRSSYQVYAVSP